MKAILPAQLLHIAAQFAATDETKIALTGIYCRPAEGGGVEILSTDGHRAFRVTCPESAWQCHEPILLSAKAFKKQIKYARIVTIDNVRLSNCANILGGKGASNQLMLSMPWQWQKPANWGSSEALANPADMYPNYNRLWPSTFGDNCDQPIAFNATYLADFAKAVAVYSKNGVIQMSRNSSISPAVFTAILSGVNLENVELQYLLMSIRVQ